MITISPAIQSKVQTAIREFTALGLQHNDLKLENMGIYMLSTPPPSLFPTLLYY
jgi:hypothetical protein